jgi:hypothetical protein
MQELPQISTEPGDLRVVLAVQLAVAVPAKCLEGAAAT